MDRHKLYRCPVLSAATEANDCVGVKLVKPTTARQVGGVADGDSGLEGIAR